MNIHLPAILMFTRGYKVLTHCHFHRATTIPQPPPLKKRRCLIKAPILAAKIGGLRDPIDGPYEWDVYVYMYNIYIYGLMVL